MAKLNPPPTNWYCRCGQVFEHWSAAQAPICGQCGQPMFTEREVEELGGRANLASVKPAAIVFLRALTPQDMLEARTVLHALGDYMNVCAEQKARGEAVDLAEWRTAGEMFLRGHRILGDAAGMPVVETSSPARAEALMAGLPGPGEPSPSKKGQA